MPFYLPTHYLIFFVLFFGFALLIWRMSNKRNVKARGRRKSGAMQSNYQGPQRRSSDKQHLNRHEKQILTKAEKLLKSGDYISGAAHYESIGYIREAVSALEDNGLIHEAAKVLMRLGINDRAGVLYMRNNMHEEAADCFRIAGMPLERARCLRQGEKFAAAADEFVKASRYGEAAESYLNAKDYLSSSYYYFMNHEHDAATDCLKKIDVNSPVKITFTKEYLDFLADKSSEITLGKFVIGQLEKHNRLVQVIKKLLDLNQVERTKVYLAVADEKIFSKIINELSLSPEQSKVIAKLFIDLNRFLEGGMLLQRLELFAEAAAAFEKAQDIDRATYCYERAGDYSRAGMLRQKDSITLTPVTEIPKKVIKEEKTTKFIPPEPTKNKSDQPKLFSSYIFSQLSQDECKILSDLGAWLPEKGNPSKQIRVSDLGFLWLLQGKSRLSLNNKTIDLSPENNFYGVNLLSGQVTSPVDIELEEGTSIYFILRETLLRALGKHPTLAGKIMLKLIQEDGQKTKPGGSPSPLDEVS